MAPYFGSSKVMGMDSKVLLVTQKGDIMRECAKYWRAQGFPAKGNVHSFVTLSVAEKLLVKCCW